MTPSNQASLQAIWSYEDRSVRDAESKLIEFFTSLVINIAYTDTRIKQETVADWIASVAVRRRMVGYD